MSRPVTISDDRILQAARTVFMREGYQARTAAIAREAGVSEGSLFKRFKSKCGLFRAAMCNEGGAESVRQELEAAVGRGSIQATLESAGMHLLRRFQTILPRIMLVRSSGVTFAGDFREPEPPPLQHARELAQYLRAERRAGRLAAAPPEIVAHALVGALYHYVMCETLFGYRPGAPRAYVRALVHALLRPAAGARLAGGKGT